MNVRITRASDSPFHLGQVVSEGTYAEMAYLVWSDGGEIPLGISTATALDDIPSDLALWLEVGHNRGILRNR